VLLSLVLLYVRVMFADKRIHILPVLGYETVQMLFGGAAVVGAIVVVDKLVVVISELTVIWLCGFTEVVVTVAVLFEERLTCSISSHNVTPAS